MIVMNNKTQLKADIIAKVNAGKLTIKSASKLLGKSIRTVERYLKEYRDKGIRFAVHQNTNRAPVNKLSTDLKEQVQSLIKTKYFDFNMTHLREELEKNEGLVVKRETLRSWAHEIHHVKRAKRGRRTKPRKRRDRMEHKGLMLQMDGSPHRWFGDEETCLIAVIDDADSTLYGEFFNAETTAGCMQVLKSYIKEHGVFKTLYVDRAGIFGGPKRSHFSQVKRACEELGIEIIFANSAEGKGRIERTFDTLQDRLVPEMRMNKVKTIGEANDYLNNKFIPNYWNEKIRIESDAIDSEYTKVPKYKNLDDIFLIKHYRKIKKDHSFSFRNKLYAITSPLEHSLANYEVEIRIDLEGGVTFYFADKQLNVKAVHTQRRSAMSSNESEARNRIRAVKLAEELCSVAEAARRTGICRQSIYRTKGILEKEGEQFFIETFNMTSAYKKKLQEERKKIRELKLPEAA